MKRILSLAVATLLLLALPVLSFTACTDPEIKVKNRIFYEYFDTVSYVYDYSGGTDAQFDEVCRGVEYELKTCHELFDIYNTYAGVTNLKTVNDSAGKGPVKVNARIIDLLEDAIELY